jgi:hypothetical protein
VSTGVGTGSDQLGYCGRVAAQDDSSLKPHSNNNDSCRPRHLPASQAVFLPYFYRSPYCGQGWFVRAVHYHISDDGHGERNQVVSCKVNSPTQITQTLRIRVGDLPAFLAAILNHNGRPAVAAAV